MSWTKGSQFESVISSVKVVWSFHVDSYPKWRVYAGCSISEELGTHRCISFMLSRTNVCCCFHVCVCVCVWARACVYVYLLFRILKSVCVLWVMGKEVGESLNNISKKISLSDFLLSYLKKKNTIKLQQWRPKLRK